MPSNDGFWKPDKSYGISGTCESLEIQWHCPVDYFEVVSDQLLWSPIGHNFQGHNQVPSLVAPRVAQLKCVAKIKQGFVMVRDRDIVNINAKDWIFSPNI